jgi:hypothetical protein
LKIEHGDRVVEQALREALAVEQAEQRDFLDPYQSIVTCACAIGIVILML